MAGFMAFDAMSTEGFRSTPPAPDILPTLLESMRSGTCREYIKGSRPNTLEIVVNGGAECDSQPVQSPALSEHAAPPGIGRSVDVRVRNTFIEVGMPSPSADGVKARAAVSCPGKRVGILHRTLAALTQQEPPAYEAEVPPVLPQQGPHLEVQAAQAARKPVLMLFDALAGEANVMPATPDPLSIGRCYGGAAMVPDVSYGKFDASFAMPNMASLAATGPAPMAQAAREGQAPESSVLGTLCPDWLRSADAQHQQQACGTVRDMTGNPSMQDRDLLWFGSARAHDGMVQEQHVQPQVLSLAHAQSQAFSQHNMAQQPGAVSLPPFAPQVPAPPVPPAFYAPASFAAPHPPAPLTPAPGTLEMPSMGSAGHGVGLCKPCAFLHTKGCENGALCKFCHICEPGEKKRRQKERKLARRGGA